MSSQPKGAQFSAVVASVCLIGLSTSCSSKLQGREWVMSAPEGFGVITSIARCADVVFLADSRLRIRRFDTNDVKFLPDLPLQTNLLATALATDCASDTLYIVTNIPLGRNKSAAVYAVAMKTGEMRREYALPVTFLPRPGARFLSPDTLIVGGLWLPADQPPESRHVSERNYYGNGLRLGVRVSISSGVVEPLVGPYEEECVGAGQCPDVRVDAIGSSPALRFIAGLPASTKVGIYASKDSRPLIVDVRTPQFVRSGEVLGLSEPVETRMRWVGKNSIISRVIAFDDVVAVVHTKYQTGDGWKMGDASPRASFLNTYRWDGRTMDADVPISEGFNLGFDEDYLYAADYGSTGAHDGAKEIVLRQIPIRSPRK